jgi:hypothetical protein
MCRGLGEQTDGVGHGRVRGMARLRQGEAARGHVLGGSRAQGECGATHTHRGGESHEEGLRGLGADRLVAEGHALARPVSRDYREEALCMPSSAAAMQH